MFRPDRQQWSSISPLSMVHPGTWIQHYVGAGFTVDAWSTADAQSTVDVPCLLRTGFQGRLNTAWKPLHYPAPDNQLEQGRLKLFWCRGVPA